MSISYRRRLIEFNKLKHKLLIKKTFSHPNAKQYFVEDDFKEIKKLDPEIAKIIWQILEENIDHLGSYAISRDTCTFCIETKLFGWRCSNCKWAKSHLKCGNKKGDFTIVQLFMNKHNIETITLEEYQSILKQVRKAIR